MPSIKFDTIVETAKVVSGFRDIQNAVHQTAERVEKDGKSIDDVISNIQNSFNIAIGGWSIGKFVNQMMQVRGQFQQTEMAFKTMLQSEEKASDLMKQMIHTAAITPFGVEDVTEGAKQLLAFNVAAEDVNKTLIGLGDVAAGMGLNLSDMVMLYGTTIAKGKMDTQDLYQFLNRGIPIADELAKVMGLDLNNAIGEVSKQIKAGKVTSDIFIQAMQNMTAEGSKFGGLMEAQSKTITGQIRNIEDAIEQMFNELGKSQEGVINTGLDIVSKLVDNWETVGKVLMTVVAAYGAYKAAVIAMIAIEKAHIALKSAQAFISLARSITSAKDAMALFNIVCSANTLGLVLGVIAAGVTAFKLFGDTTADVSTQTKKFGDDASQATAHVESLIAILKNAKKDSKVYSETVKELSGIYGNYGIQLQKIKDDESNLVDVKDEEIKKSQQLVEQIKLESVERNRANAISQANEDYNSKIEEATSKLREGLKDAFGNIGEGVAVGIENIISPQEIDKINQLQAAMQRAKEGSKEWLAAREALSKQSQEQYQKIIHLAQANGIESSSYEKLYKYINKYQGTLSEARGKYVEVTNAVNTASYATETFGSKSTKAQERVREISRQLQKAGEDVHTLYGRVKAFMENYADNDIKFHVKFDAETPAWMKNMDIPELGRMGKFFSALAKDLANNNKSGAKVNGKWMSRDAIAQRGWDYTKAANDKQTEKEDKAKKDAKAKADAAEEAKKKAKDAKKSASDAKKKADDQRKAQEELNEDLKQLRQQNTDDDISQMREGTEKKLAEIKNDYKKRLAEIDKQEAEFKKKNKEAGKSSSLTKEQSDALQKARDLANQNFDKQNTEVDKESLDAMRDYLKEYGSLYQQKQAIAEEYEEKIAKAQTEGEKKTLQQQKKQALANFDYESISMGIDWKGLLSGVGSMSKEMLQPMFDKLDAYTKTGKFQQADSQTQQKVVDLMQEIRSYLGTDQNATWQTLAKNIQDFNQSVVAYQSSVNAEQYWIEKKKEYEKEWKVTGGGSGSGRIKMAEQQIKTFGDAAVNAKNKMNILGVQLNSTTDAVKNYTSGLTAALNKLGTWKGNEGFSEVQSAFGSVDALKGALDESLATMGDGMAKTIGEDLSKTIGSTLGSLGSSVEGLLSKGIGSIIGIVAQIPKLILNIASAIKNFVTGILNSFTELLQFNWLSDLVDSILDSVGNLIDAIFDLPENLFNALEKIIVNGVGGLLDSVVGRIGNVLSLGALSSDGPSSWFTNSNAAKVNQRIDELTESNERLDDSINRLKNTMDKSYGQQAKQAYEEAKRQQQQKNDNLKEIAQQKASYHASHHSWNSYWNGFSADEIKQIQEAIGKDFNGDIWSLDENDMSTMLGYQWFVDKIRKTGKMYKGRSAYGESVLEALQNYADAAGTVEELTDEFKENLTQISFDSMKDSFISNLMDMTKSAQDFSDDFAEMMQKALLSYSMEDLMNGDLKKLYDDWAKAIDDSKGQLTDKQINDFNQRYDDIVAEGLKRRDDWAKLTGYTGSSSQSATSGGWSSMGQETADELNGRFTALQIAGETIAKDMATNVEQMETIVTIGISTNGAVLEIRNMMIMTNSYLEDIMKYNKLIYMEFGSKIDDMNAKLKNI